jgi:hypothetical protein
VHRFLDVDTTQFTPTEDITVEYLVVGGGGGQSGPGGKGGAGVVTIRYKAGGK